MIWEDSSHFWEESGSAALNPSSFSLPFSSTAPLSIDIPVNAYTLPSPTLCKNNSTSLNSSKTAAEDINITNQLIVPIPPPVAFRSLAFIAPPTHEPQTSTILTPTTKHAPTQATPSYITNNSQSNISIKSASCNKPEGHSDTDILNSTHEKNIFATNAATAAAIVAINHGATELEAMLKGSDAAKKARKSYSQVVATKSTNNTKIKKITLSKTMLLVKDNCRIK